MNAAPQWRPGAGQQRSHGEGWMITIRPDDPAATDALLDAAAYRALIGA